MILVPKVVESVDLPVLAAGGMADGKSLAAAFALGADGIMMATRFLATKESNVQSPNMKEYQLHQDREGEIILNIVKKEGFSDEDVRHIRENFQKRLGDEFSLSLVYVDSIPLTSRGKYQFLIQKIPIHFSR